MVFDIEPEATKPLHNDDIALEVMNRKGWARDPDLLETVTDKIKDVRKRTTVSQGWVKHVYRSHCLFI